MSGLIRYNNLYFLTCTITKWKDVLKSDENKQILLDGFSFLVAKKRAVIYAFVILDNHFHLIIEVIPPSSIIDVKHSLLSYSSKKFLSKMNIGERKKFQINRSNKSFQIWKPESLNVQIFSSKFFEQKFHYGHKNVARAGLSEEEYRYSSVPCYLTGESEFDFLTLWC